jgi:hypothetical protein
MSSVAKTSTDKGCVGAGLQREYSAEGMLMEVRSRTAVKGGWVGGRM